MGVGDTYTSQYGNTPQGNQVQNMANTLSSITGNPAMGAYLASAQAGPNYSNTYIPQGMSDAEKIQTMFANDQTLAQKYANPNVYGGAQTPPAGNPAGFASSPLQATLDSIMASGGMTTPAAITGAIGADVSGQKSTMQNVMDAMDFGKTRTLDAYKSMLDALKTLAQDQNAKELEMIRQGYLSGDGSGYTAQDYADQFLGGMVDWVDIPTNIKGAVTKIVKNSGLTVDKVQGAHTGLKNSVQILNKVLNSWTDLSPLERILPQGAVQAIPALSPTRAGITSLFYTTLEPELRKAAVGGRITQQEINWIRDAIIPKWSDTEASAKAKVGGVLEGINMKLQNPDYALGGDNVSAADLAPQQ